MVCRVCARRTGRPYHIRIRRRPLHGGAPVRPRLRVGLRRRTRLSRTPCRQGRPARSGTGRGPWKSARREGRLRGRLRAEPDSGGGSKATEFRVLEAIRGVEVGRIVRIGADPRVCSSALHGPDVCRRGFVAGEIGGKGDKVLVGFRNSGMPGPPRVPDRPRRLAAPGAFATVHPSAAWSRPRRNPGARVVRGPRGSPRRRRPTSSRRRGRRCRPRRAAPRARRASCCRRTARD